MPHEKYKACIQACNSCAVACSHCAIECLNEDQVNEMIRCIQLDIECAAMCRSASELMSIGSEHSLQLCRMCANVCSACAEECEMHDVEHCRQCAEACRKCADECNQMASA
jgi:hypothetical protein